MIESVPIIADTRTEVNLCLMDAIVVDDGEIERLCAGMGTASTMGVVPVSDDMSDLRDIPPYKEGAVPMLNRIMWHMAMGIDKQERQNGSKKLQS